VEHNRSLREMLLQGNRLSAECGMKLCIAALRNPQLWYLRLAGNHHIRAKDRCQIGKSMRQNRSMWRIAHEPAVQPSPPQPQPPTHHAEGGTGHLGATGPSRTEGGNAAAVTVPDHDANPHETPRLSGNSAACTPSSAARDTPNPSDHDGNPHVVDASYTDGTASNTQQLHTSGAGGGILSPATAASGAGGHGVGVGAGAGAGAGVGVSGGVHASGSGDTTPTGRNRHAPGDVGGGHGGGHGVEDDAHTDATANPSGGTNNGAINPPTTVNTSTSARGTPPTLCCLFSCPLVWVDQDSHLHPMEMLNYQVPTLAM